MLQFFLDSSQFIISGALVGLLVGMTGVGGGSGDGGCAGRKSGAVGFRPWGAGVGLWLDSIGAS